ncbi:TetR family transcriptional regulator [Rhodopirellula sallentina SM41]|uniref:TetR family transcriptional regulator n=1 Tax=Rhodopirellula sallentina SM41 TaxID=1263870 RepID=M5U536_9BACT|nr:TetR family transcriptional regulator [Rhodopirellula sallentina SM41]
MQEQRGDRLTDRKRCAILQAAVQEFQSRGFYSASMNGIAEVASVSKRTLYNHFESKDALFDAMVQELLSRAKQLPNADFDPTRDLAEQLTELAESEVEFMTSDAVMALARACISRVLAEPEVGKQVDQRQFRHRIETWIGQAQASGYLVESDCEVVAAQFCGLLQTFAFWPTILQGEPGPSRKKKQQIVASTVAMILSQYQA